MTFGEAIRRARKRLHWTQERLASEILGDQSGTPIKKSYLSKIESGAKPPPSDEMIERFADKLDVNATYLYLLAGRLPPILRERLSTQAELHPDPVIDDWVNQFLRITETGPGQTDMLILALEICRIVLQQPPSRHKEVRTALEEFIRTIRKGHVGRPPVLHEKRIRPMIRQAPK